MRQDWSYISDREQKQLITIVKDLGGGTDNELNLWTGYLFKR